MEHTPIYLDHHATTPLDERVLEAMLPYLREHYGNPASTHPYGRVARAAVDHARERVAATLGAQPSEIVFTSGATESDNLAIKGVARALGDRGRHLITSAIEHRGVLESCRRLESEGWRVTYLQPDDEGNLSPASVEAAIESDTVLVSIMLANNEVGTLLDIAAIGALVGERGILMHTDAAQGIGKVERGVFDQTFPPSGSEGPGSKLADVATLNVDLLSLSGHKIYGPKGVGALYVRKHGAGAPRLVPELEGGGQEEGLRSGTLNVPGIVGLGAACEILEREAATENARLRRLRERLRQRLMTELPETRLNGSDDPRRHPGNLHLSFRCVDAASLMMRLSEKVACSIGSACASGSGDASYVLRAMGRTNEEARTGIRFGLGRRTTEEEIDQAAAHVITEVRALREASAAWKLLQAGVDPEAIEW